MFRNYYFVKHESGISVVYSLEDWLLKNLEMIWCDVRWKIKHDWQNVDFVMSVCRIHSILTWLLCMIKIVHNKTFKGKITKFTSKKSTNRASLGLNFKFWCTEGRQKEKGWRWEEGGWELGNRGREGMLPMCPRYILSVLGPFILELIKR